MTTNYYTFKFGDFERKLLDACGWEYEEKFKNGIILSDFKYALKKRMHHCSNKVLTNQSGVVYNDGVYVTFKDGSRFSRPAYIAMEKAIEKISNATSAFEYLRGLDTLELIQLTKAVGCFTNYLTPKEILMDILMEHWINFKFNSNEK